MGVEKGESFHDLLPQVDWLFEDDAYAYPLPPMPTPVPVAEEGALFSEEKKKKNNNNKETVSFPGFPALKQLQPQPQEVVSEDSANTGTNTTSCPPQGKKRSAPEASGSDLDCSCCEEDSSKSDAKKPKVEGADVEATATTKRKEQSNSGDTTVALDRKEKNRRSAALSRERKKAAMDSMLLRCKALESTNATLNYLLSMANVEIQALRRELASSNTSARSVGNKGQKSTETEQTGPTYLPEVGVTPFSVPPCPSHGHHPSNQLTGLLTCLPKEANGKIAIPSLPPRRRNPPQYSHATTTTTRSKQKPNADPSVAKKK